MRRLCPRLLLAAAVGGLIWFAWPRSPAVGQPIAAAPAPATDASLRYMGVASCTSTACHGDNGPRAVPKRSEYSIWAAHDRHGRAFQVLYDERSERMVRNLFPDRKQPATETPECLVCHSTTNGDPAKTPHGDRFYAGDGVGCEACHGPAERWLTTHYKPGWNALSDRQKEDLGFRPLKDLTVRARLCTECHVGTKDRDVNHDLIAAGHPRLNFELASFHANYPKHWPLSDDLARHPDLESRLWVIGQVASAGRSLELLEARAAGAASRTHPKPWPEFAEYACYACHKDLQVLPIEQLKARARSQARQEPGTFPWGTWYLFMPQLYGTRAKGESKDLNQRVQKLKGLMARPGQDAATVAREAGAAARDANAWLARVGHMPTLTAPEVRDLLRFFAADAARRAPVLDWDEATQLYLSLAALNVGLADLGARTPPEVTANLGKIRNRLRDAFPKDYNSPHNFNATRNPANQPSFRQVFEDIRTQLGQ